MGRVRWARKAASVVVAVLVASLTAAGNVGAFTPNPEPQFASGGSLVIVWHGVARRGCAAEGLCGVSGSLHLTPTGDTGAGSPIGPVQLDLVARSRATVKVVSTSPAIGQACTDRVPVEVVLSI